MSALGFGVRPGGITNPNRDAESQRRHPMTYAAPIPATRPVPVPIAIPVFEWLPWAAFVGALMLALVYLVGGEQGATAVIGGHYVHELVHDARHLLGFPCH